MVLSISLFSHNYSRLHRLLQTRLSLPLPDRMKPRWWLFPKLILTPTNAWQGHITMALAPGHIMMWSPHSSTDGLIITPSHVACWQSKHEKRELAWALIAKTDIMAMPSDIIVIIIGISVVYREPHRINLSGIVELSFPSIANERNRRKWMEHGDINGWNEWSAHSPIGICAFSSLMNCWKAHARLENQNALFKFRITFLEYFSKFNYYQSNLLICVHSPLIPDSRYFN